MPRPGIEPGPSAWPWWTVYHVAIKAGLYCKAVKEYHIPIPGNTLIYKILWKKIVRCCALCLRPTFKQVLSGPQLCIPGMSCIWRVLQSASLCKGTLQKSALWRFLTVFGADSLSETERCIATRQNKMAAPDMVSARFKKLNFCCCCCCSWTKCSVHKWP